MHIYFSGIGGAGANSFALIASQAGHEVSGSDAKDSSTIDYLKKRGIDNILIGQSREAIESLHSQKPIDLFVYTSALPMTDPDHPELAFCQEKGIRCVKHDEFLADFLHEQNLELIAIAGTHGKSTTTAMAVWLAQQFDFPISWSIGAKANFADSGHFDPKSRYFICEADEFDRKFLSYFPALSLIPGIDWDHPDIYPTRESYYHAFREFFDQSEKVVLWQTDAEKLAIGAEDKYLVLDQLNPEITEVGLAGQVNREDAWLVANGLTTILSRNTTELAATLKDFPGLSRRFEKISDNIYSDYAHTPPKIRGALQLAHEVVGDDVVVVYEGLHNLRQHFIKDELKDLFNDIKKLYVVPSYLAREDPALEVLLPDSLIGLLDDKTRAHAEPAALDQSLKSKISEHAKTGDLVLCLSGGGAGSLDEWLRREFS